MTLQESLRELVATRGLGVTADPNEFRGALDDFLDENEATTGQVNVLVDAVRLGGLTRLVALLDNGADPQAAVMEAGAALARDRGSDDDRRSRWAVAVLGYALGRLDAAAVPTQGIEKSGSGSLPTALNQGSVVPPPPPPPPGGGFAPPSEPSGTVYADAAPGSGPGHAPIPGPGSVPSRPTMPAGPISPRVPQPVAPSAPPRRRGIGLVVLAIAVVLGLAAGVGVAVWQTQRGDDTSSGDTGTPSSDGSDSSAPAGALPPSDIVVDYKLPTGNSILFAVDPADGRWQRLTEGPDDYLPAISPDRTKVAYLVGPDTPRVLWVDDLTKPEGTGGKFRKVFSSSGACAHALRPGFSPEGDKFAIVCTGDDGTTDGLFIAHSDGRTDVADQSDDFLGSATWTDEDSFVYLRTSTPTTIWQYDDSTADADPQPLTLTDADGSAALPDGAVVSHLDWSDNQHRLLFLVHTPDPATGTIDLEFGDLWTSNADGTDAEPAGGEPVGHPVWGPLGDRVAAVALVPGGRALVTLRVSQPDPVIIANAPKGRIGIPVWASR